MKEDAVPTILKNAGLKVTSHRVAIYEYLHKYHKPISINQLYHKMESTGMDKVTVYRAIASLKDAMLVKQIDLGEDQAYFEIVDEHDHHHVVCQKCKKISDFTGCGIEDVIEKALNQTGFAQINNHALELFGVCKSCTK